MMTKKLLSVSLVFVCAMVLCASDLMAQVGGVYAKLACRTRKSDTAYVYQYELINLSPGVVPLQGLKIETGDLIAERGGTIDDAQVHTTKSWLPWDAQVAAMPRDPAAKGIIAFGVADSTSSVDNLYSPAPSAIIVGDSISFSFQSRGLPTLKRFWVEGWKRPITIDQYDSLSLLGLSDHDIFSTWYESEFPGRTVAPTLPTLPLEPLAFLDTLSTYVSQSRSLGWIPSQNVAEKYSSYLNNARSQIQNSNLVGAFATLQSVLSEVNIDSSSALTSEAYALIRFNTEYLRDHLSEGPPPITNILQNPGFESGTDYWSFYTNGSGGMDTTSPAYQGSASGRIAISGSGSNVQLYQANISLQPHTLYRLSFAAKSNNGHDVSVTLQKHGTPYTNYGLSAHVLDLTSTWAAYSFEFNTDNFETAVNDGRLMFWLAPYAAAGDEYWLDEVSLGVVGDTVQIPPAPSLSSPGNTSTGISLTPTLSWNASTGAAIYRLQVSTSSGFGTTVVNQSGISTTSYAPGSLSASTTYYWRVNATNSAGTSSWSSVWSFTTTDGGGGGTNILTNPGFDDGTSPWYFYTNGSGSWSDASPGHTGTAAARINITAAGSNVQLQQAGIELEPSTAYRLTFAAKCTTGHDVEVSLFKNGAPYTNYGLASGTVNLTSSWNTFTYDFTTSGFESTGNDGRLMIWLADYAVNGDEYWFDDFVLAEPGSGPPQAPALSTPTNGTVTADTAVTLNWNAASGATGYRVQVSTSDQFTSFFLDDSTLQGTSRALTGLANQTTYYWRVNARNAAGTSSWSSVWHFEVQREAPQAPTLSSPQNNATGVSASPTLAWNASSGATSYRVQVSRTSSFSTTIVNDSGITATSRSIEGLSEDTTYYWRLNAKNNYGTSSWSSAWSFTTASGGGGTNLLSNGGFESGTSSWNFYTSGEGSFDAGTPAYQDSASGIVSITTTGSNMQLNQTGFTLQEGATYQLQFAVKANHARSIRVFIHKNTTPYDNFGLDEWVELGTSWSTKTYTFTASEFSGQTTNTRLRFWFVDEAQAGDAFSFDSITLVRQ